MCAFNYTGKQSAFASLDTEPHQYREKKIRRRNFHGFPKLIQQQFLKSRLELYKHEQFGTFFF
jgi:hypothetical protein